MEEVTLVKSKFLRNLFDQNTYVLSNGREAVIIDAGAELEDIRQITKKQKVLAVFLTHLHFDHFWNLDKFIQEFRCPVYVVDDFSWKFQDCKANGSTVIRQEFKKEISQNCIKYYAKNLKIGNFDFKIYNTPGHSKDSVCILVGDKLFTGDTVFADSIGRTDLVDSDESEMINSLKAIKEMKYNTAYPGHYQICDKKQIDKVIDFYL